MTSSTLSPTHGAVTTKQKVGLVLAALYGLSNIPSVLIPAPDGAEAGPPFAILVIDTVLGVVAVVTAVIAWRGNRVALRLCAGATILVTLTALPAFFVDVPMGIKALVGLSVVITVVAVVLMFSTDRRAAAVVD